MNNVIDMKGYKEAPKSARSSMETLIVSIDQANAWLLPPFQRPLRVNNKIANLADEIKRDEAIPGIITLGKLGKDSNLYLVDGQHRAHAFRMSGLQEAIVDVRIVHFTSMGEMADEFVELNSALVRMRPDDLLRGLEASTPAMMKIRSECGYVGYDYIRRGTNSPIVSMSLLLRGWGGSLPETPVAYSSGQTAAQFVATMDAQSTDQLIRFLHLAFAAWGREPEYFRLWGSLNLGMCMWLYRRLVLDRVRGVKRFVVLTDAQFRQCLMSLSADTAYLEWLQGRALTERDRSPCYSHVKRIFVKRLQDEGNIKALMPQPVWVRPGRS